MSIHRNAGGRIRIRDHVAVISSVSCANIVCERLASARPDLAVLTHQHGCGQLGEDNTLTRELLAALAAHPNVHASLVISLGCETNAPRDLMAAIRRRGGVVDAIGIQALGGVNTAYDAAMASLARLRPGARQRAVVTTSELMVGVIPDATTRKYQPQLAGAIVDALSAEGFAHAEPGRLELAPRSATTDTGHLSIPSRWKTNQRTQTSALSQIATAPCSLNLSTALGADHVEQLTVMAGLGAHVLVSLTGRPNLTGSAIAPTICVSTNPELDRLTDLVDVPAHGDNLPARVVAEVRAVISGRRTKAERLGMRDLALPRLGPSY